MAEPNPTPRTIEELKAWYTAHNLPPEEVTRFFIGKDIREPRAFGIYRDGDRFIVYKNKDDGKRAVRYEGIDEGYAVNQLYLRLKQEIGGQKAHSAEKARAERRRILIIAAVIAAAVIALIFWLDRNEPRRGYYHYDDAWYYCQAGAWYFDDDLDWIPCREDPPFAENSKDFYCGEECPADTAVPDFSATEYYSATDTDSTWDSSDSWDSGSTDWSSDW